MISRKSLIKLFTFLMVASLLIGACDRPLPSSNNDNTQATAEGYPTGGETEQAAQPEPTRAIVEGGEAAGGQTEEGQETTEGGEPAVGETPEGEAPTEETATATQEVMAEGETSSETPTEETPAEGASEGVAEETPEAEPTAEEETPQETAPEVTEGEETTPEPAQPSVQVTLPTTHTVAAGENLYRIGLQYGLSWVVIARYNQIANPNQIYAGQVLEIPSGDSVTGGQPEPSPTPTGINYIVKAGDTLYKIAQQYGISWTEIAEANGLVNPNQIYTGQTLKIPVNAPAPATNHVVQPGETLYQISLQYGVPWIVIADANHIAPPFWVYSGQTLVIPGGQ